MRKEKCAGYISLVFFDDKANETVTIGGAGFLTEVEFRAAWDNLVEFTGKSNFQADHLDAQGDIIGEKCVDVVTCERLMGKPITTLIIDGRANLVAELVSHRKAA